MPRMWSHPSIPLTWTLAQSGTGASADAPVADVGGQRRVEDLDGLEVEGPDPVEEPLARAEQHGCDVEGELVDHAGGQGLSHGRGPTGDVDTAVPGGLAGGGVGRLEAVGDEVEGRALQLDRVVAVVGEHE